VRETISRRAEKGPEGRASAPKVGELGFFVNVLQASHSESGSRSKRLCIVTRIVLEERTVLAIDEFAVAKEHISTRYRSRFEMERYILSTAITSSYGKAVSRRSLRT